LEQRQVVRWQLVAGVARRQLGGGEHLVCKIKLLAGGECAGEDDLIRSASVDGAGDLEQKAFTFSFQVIPQLEGAQQQGYVGGVLVVGEADDARDSMR
jgi:hypothetical protein